MKVYTKIIFIILSITFFIGCNGWYKDSKFYKETEQLNDKLLNGTFIEYVCYSNCSSWDKDYRYTELTFTGTNQVNFKQYTPTTSKQEGLDFYVFEGQYKFQDWYDENNWTALQNYTLIGNVLTLTNFMNETYILSK